MATRIERLARPKPNLLKFPDRAHITLVPAVREEKINTHYEDNRESPEWKVGAATLKARPSERVCSLARPRLRAVGWQPDRPLLTTFGMGVGTKAKASPQICQLAQPKRSRMPLTPAFNSTNSYLTLPQQAKPSSHIHLLAIPKKEHPHYRPNQPVSSHVPRSVLEAVASERLQVLAIPKPHKPLFEGFDPYKVSLAARAAAASPRIQELSRPPARRCRKTSAQDE